MKGLIAAINFLTCLPIGKTCLSPGSSLLYFPLAGLFIGVILILVYHLFKFLPYSVISLILLLTWIIITGALHLDGFADTLEGFYAGKTREEILKIMRDLNRGTIGIVGLILIILAKFIFLENIDKDMIIPALLTIPVISRYSMVECIFSSNYAREEGKAEIFFKAKRQGYFFITFLFTFLISLFFLRIRGLIILSLISLITFLINSFIKKRIQGVTGDTLGFINELSEVLGLLFVIVL